MSNSHAIPRTMTSHLLARRYAGLSLCYPLLAAVAAAQSPIPTQVLREDPGCRSCTIRVDSVRSLGDPDGPGMFDHRPTQALLSARGAIYVGLAPPSGLAYVFDSTGRFVKRVGTKGRGPGEYTDASAMIAGPRDSITIIDLFNNRTSVLSPTGQFARAFPLPIRSVLAVSLANGNTAMSGTSRALGQVGEPFHLIDAEGRVLRSFGAEAPVPARLGTSIGKRLTASRDNSFWAAATSSYSIERWSDRGERLQSFTRTVNWFANVDTPSSGSRGTMPTPKIVAMREDADGYLWLLIQVASTNWRRALGPPKQEKGVGVTYPDLREDLAYDTVVEVIDPRRGTVLTSRRLPGSISCFIADNLVGRYVEDSDGVPRLVIMRMRLER
jgi:hypothetical protein